MASHTPLHALAVNVIVVACSVAAAAEHGSDNAGASAICFKLAEADALLANALLDCDVDIVALAAAADMLELVLCDNNGKSDVDEINESHVVA